MTFKEFSAWCNQRACDGMWGMNEALACLEVGKMIYKVPFWKREKEWQKWNADWHMEEIFVKPTNERIAEVLAMRAARRGEGEEG